MNDIFSLFFFGGRYISKAPGFLFSSYQILAWEAPLLIGVDSFTNIAFKAYDHAQNFDKNVVAEGETFSNSNSAAAASNTSTGNKTQGRLNVLKRVGKNPFLTSVDVRWKPLSIFYIYIFFCLFSFTIFLTSSLRIFVNIHIDIFLFFLLFFFFPFTRYQKSVS